MKYALPPALLVLFALSACSDDPASTGPKLNCPNVAVLQQTGRLTVFLPEREDVAAEITTANVTGVAGACTLEAKKQAVRVTFKIGFTATNGPANKAPSLDLPYFVAIVEGDDIIQKSLYSIPVSFDGNITLASATSKPVTVELPNDQDTGQTQILVGFQLTPEQQVYAADHPGP